MADPSIFSHAASPEKEQQVKQILQRMESEVLAFRDHMEVLAASRCDADTLASCAENNYNDCSSTYPLQECMAADDLVHPACGDGATCNALWSQNVTATRIPAALAVGPSGNPLDPQVVEGVCYSRLAEPYMVENYRPGHQMYFGSVHGSFRIAPARHSEVCGAYDPRRRPWFVAASSGPKDVVLAIDVSGSMDDYGRMEMAKEAAMTIIDTLTVADRFAIVTFSDEATQVGGQGRLVRATEQNKKTMIAEIRQLEAGGRTNYGAAFEAAFDAIDATIDQEATSGCNVAVLFLTDGAISKGLPEDEVIDLVNERVARIATEDGQKTTIFTFSLGDKADHDVTKRIACSTNGIHTAVDDFADDLVSAMSSYYKLYAMGLGEGGNQDWVAWVEPYAFHTAGKLGTSASAPVYDRSVHPPQFLGVVTVDMFMDKLEEILGEEASSSKMLDRFVTLSTARCPAIELEECEIEALRLAGGGATCGTCPNATANGGRAGVMSDACEVQGDMPESLWDNTDMAGKGFAERACCEIGGTSPSDVCPLEPFDDDQDLMFLNDDEADNENNGVLIVAIIAANVGLLLVIVCMWTFHKWHKAQQLPRADVESGCCVSSMQHKAEPWMEIPQSQFSGRYEDHESALTTEMGTSDRGTSDREMARQDSVDPPAMEQAARFPAAMGNAERYTRQISVDPPADEPTFGRADTSSRNVAPFIASSHSSNLDAELEARLKNLSR